LTGEWRQDYAPPLMTRRRTRPLSQQQGWQELQEPHDAQWDMFA
jgi:hypothetical protein